MVRSLGGSGEEWEDKWWGLEGKILVLSLCCVSGEVWTVWILGGFVIGGGGDGEVDFDERFGLWKR